MSTEQECGCGASIVKALAERDHAREVLAKAIEAIDKYAEALANNSACSQYSVIAARECSRRAKAVADI